MNTSLVQLIINHHHIYSYVMEAVRKSYIPSNEYSFIHLLTRAATAFLRNIRPTFSTAS